MAHTCIRCFRCHDLRSAMLTFQKTRNFTQKHHHHVLEGISVVSTDRRPVSFWGSSKVTDWSKAVSEAEKIVGYPTSFMSLRCLLSDELSNVAMQMRKLVGTKHPLLKTARQFFYDGKHSMQTRGLLVLLISKTAGPSPSENHQTSEAMTSGIYQSQRSLAEIIEMINTANMIHNGVVNLSELKPTDGSKKDMHFGNKMSVLSGDFLLANASVGLAELNNTYVVEIISSAIGDLMEGEFIRLRDSTGRCLLPESVTMKDWEHDTYMNSGSLVSKSCKAAMMLAGHDEVWQENAYQFGMHVSFAHQLKEDVGSFVDNDDTPSCPKVTSAPVVLFAKNNPEKARELGFFDNPNVEVSLLRKVIRENQKALEEARILCKDHGEKALDALQSFRDSEAKLALKNIVHAITTS